MTHEQLVRRAAAREGVSIRDAARIARSYAEEIGAALARGDAVTIRHVGTLRPPRVAGGRTTFRASVLGRSAGDVCDGPEDC